MPNLDDVLDNDDQADQHGDVSQQGRKIVRTLRFG